MKKTTLKIDGMMCGMCEAHINDAIRAAFPIKKISSSHSKGECVIISEDELDSAKIADVIKNTGYTLVSSSSEPYEKKRSVLLPRQINRESSVSVNNHGIGALFLSESFLYLVKVVYHPSRTVREVRTGKRRYGTAQARNAEILLRNAAVHRESKKRGSR